MVMYAFWKCQDTTLEFIWNDTARDALYTTMTTRFPVPTDIKFRRCSPLFDLLIPCNSYQLYIYILYKFRFLLSFSTILDHFYCINIYYLVVPKAENRVLLNQPCLAFPSIRLGGFKKRKRRQNKPVQTRTGIKSKIPSEYRLVSPQWII